jgi:uncharacterized membrane protein YgcG
MTEIIVVGALVAAILVGILWGLRGRPKERPFPASELGYPKRPLPSERYFVPNTFAAYPERMERRRYNPAPRATAQPPSTDTETTTVYTYGSSLLYDAVETPLSHTTPSFEPGGGEFGGGGASGSWDSAQSDSYNEPTSGGSDGSSSSSSD